MAGKKCKGTELDVFKGREARLNRAIFFVIAKEGPQTIYNIHKLIRTQTRLRRTYYANVNKRVRALEQSSYLRILNKQKTKAGFEASVYEISQRAYLALLINSVDMNDILVKLDEGNSSEILAILLSSLMGHERKINQTRL